MPEEKRNVALIMDRFRMNPDATTLSTATPFFLPQTTTSMALPCDAGINRSWKCIYQKGIIFKVLKANDKKTFELNLYEAMKADVTS